MKAAELKLAFPHQAKNVKQDPLPDCPECKGTGQKGRTVCLCACVSETDPDFRRAGVKAFYDSVRKFRDQFKKS